jgi:hypothetical protein
MHSQYLLEYLVFDLLDNPPSSSRSLLIELLPVQSVMQKSSTLDFWDEFYEKNKKNPRQELSRAGRGTQDVSTTEPHNDEDDNYDGNNGAPYNNAPNTGVTESLSSTEWILQPTDALLELLCSMIVHPTSGESAIAGAERIPSLRFLEIGAGTSHLSRQLFRHLREIRQDQKSGSGRPSSSVSALVTDVSPVCILQNRQRDSDFSGEAGGSFLYDTLNIATSALPDELCASFDFILDKGCLDTFLFRTRHRGGRRKEILMNTVLDNLYAMLKADEHCCLLILSPRSNARSLREHNGFACQRHELDRSVFSLGDLDGDKMQSRDALYLYVCRKRPDYDPSQRAPEPTYELSDDDACPKCSKTFRSFRGGHHRLENRGTHVWYREWTGHKAHCTATKS